MNMPNLDILIKVIECDNWRPLKCQNCPYGYQYWDDHGDNPFWACDEQRIYEETLFFLKMYQLAIKEHENENN